VGDSVGTGQIARNGRNRVTKDNFYFRSCALVCSVCRGMTPAVIANQESLDSSLEWTKQDLGPTL